MKRAMVLCVTLLMALCLTTTTFAATAEEGEKADVLNALGLFSGTGTDSYGNPVYELDRTPNRYEAVTMLVRLLGKEEEAKAGVWSTPFADVVDWAKPYVGYAYTNGLTSGTSATTFGGVAQVSATQYLTFVLRALGYVSGEDFEWDKAWELTDAIGMTAGEYGASATSFTRGDAVAVSYSALSATKKNSGNTLLDVLKSEGAVKSDATLTGGKMKLAYHQAEGSQEAILADAYVTKLFTGYRFTLTFYPGKCNHVAFYPAGWGSPDYPTGKYPNFKSLIYHNSRECFDTLEFTVPFDFISKNPINNENMAINLVNNLTTSYHTSGSIGFKVADLP